MNSKQWDIDERAVEAMIPLIGELYRERKVEISVFGQLMVKRTVNDILHAHEEARQIEEIELYPKDSLNIVNMLTEMPLSSAHVDIGKLAVKWYRSGQPDRQEFLNAELADALDSEDDQYETKQVVLYGFGRIGRLLALSSAIAPAVVKACNSQALLYVRAKVTTSKNAPACSDRTQYTVLSRASCRLTKKTMN